MITSDFVLDSRLAADARPVGDLPLCRVLLMNDARFPWLVLVPRRTDAVEIIDLSSEEQARLIGEIAQVSRALRAVAPCDKLNVGALGNIVKQLHVHIVSRVEGDPAWPGPVWGSGAARPYDENWRNGLIGAIRTELGL
ncbi:HIT domain-containing protein [Flaviflagellibacter deserti]|uniref:HIT domain-containing protein n=1 Tax=Flaviflagellibacter deserti TaxID=2267266 RepID=A0ABV9YY17_9HYPH